MQKLYYLGSLSAKKVSFTFFGFFLLFALNAQPGPPANPGPPTNPGKPPGTPGKGPRSDNKTPHSSGMVQSALVSVAPMLSPTGWGSTENFVFVTADGTPNQLYSSKPDMAVRTGLGIGDSRKTVSVVGILNWNNVSEPGKNLSGSFIVSRSFGKLGSVSAGALHLFANEEISDGIASYYVAYSNEIKGLPQVTPGNPRLSFSIGAGSGNFYTKSPSDYEGGKGRYGSVLFANISYDLIKNLTINAEWTGMNLGLTTAYRLPGKLPILFAGVSDLTRYSGDSPMFVFGIGKAIGFRK